MVSTRGICHMVGWSVQLGFAHPQPMPHTSTSAVTPSAWAHTTTAESAGARGASLAHAVVAAQRPPWTKKSATERSGSIRTVTTSSDSSSVNVEPVVAAVAAAGGCMTSGQAATFAVATPAATVIAMPRPPPRLLLTSTHAPTLPPAARPDQTISTSAEAAAPASRGRYCH